MFRFELLLNKMYTKVKYNLYRIVDTIKNETNEMLCRVKPIYTSSYLLTSLKVIVII